mgnify:CR=1 FL=1
MIYKTILDYKEATKDLSLKVFDTESADSFKVLGRGEMHISILVENDEFFISENGRYDHHLEFEKTVEQFNKVDDVFNFFLHKKQPFLMELNIYRFL